MHRIQHGHAAVSIAIESSLLEAVLPAAETTESINRLTTKLLRSCAGFRNSDRSAEQASFKVFEGKEVSFGLGLDFKIKGFLGAGDDRRAFLAEMLNDDNSLCALKVSREIPIEDIRRVNNIRRREPAYIMDERDRDGLDLLRGNIREIAALCRLGESPETARSIPKFYATKWVRSGTKGAEKSCIIAMEYIKGISFGEYMREDFAKSQDNSELCKVLASALKSLDRAAKRGVFISDLDWSNMIVRRNHQHGEKEVVFIDLQQSMISHPDAAQNSGDWRSYSGLRYDDAWGKLRCDAGEFLIAASRLIQDKNSQECKVIHKLFEQLRWEKGGISLERSAKRLRETA